MNKFWGILIGIFLFAQSISWADSINLFNDSPYMLKATIYDANGMMLGEFVLNPRDATEWSNDQNFGTQPQYAAQSPYSVNWYCMNGGAYGICNFVAPGSIVTAQSCGGAQECPQQQQEPY